MDSGFAADDPVHLASRRTSAGFAWSEIGSLIRLNSRHKEILAGSRRFGLGDGFTVPVNVPGEPNGSCSFALSARSKLSPTRLFCAEIIGTQAFKAARRLTAAQTATARPHLSRREIECVRLVALGKSDWEIGVILGISAETAKQYVKRSRLAYGVANRTQLAVCALYDGWIDFTEIMPQTDKRTPTADEHRFS